MNDDNNIYSISGKSPDKRQQQEKYPLASRWSRLAAFILDEFITVLLILPFISDIDFVAKMESDGMLATEDIFLISVSQILVFILINSYLLLRYGQSIGKRIMGIAIASYKDTRVIPLLNVLGLRYLPFWLIAIISPFVKDIGILGDLLTFVWMLDKVLIFRPDQRCLHDFFVGSKVIDVRHPNYS